MPQEIVFCKGGGCTAKLGPDLLSHVLAKLPRGEKTAICSSDMIAVMMRQCTKFQMTRR